MTEWDAYERISDDPTDARAGVSRQRDDNDSAVLARGGRVVEHLTENNTSAYKKKRVRLTDPLGNAYDGYRVVRPVWAEALRRLRSGESRRLMVWDLDRLARDPRDLEDAIEVVEHYGAEIRSATASDIDLSTETGRMNARLLVLMANKSSADTARRVKRQKQQRLAEGMPLGSRYRTYGYSRDWQVIADEAAVVRETFKRVAAGESVNSITKDLHGRGVMTASGRPWSFQATSRMLDSPIYAGLLTYKGEIVGESAVPTIVTEALYQLAQTRETKPAWNTRKHLLSGIATCDVCKTPMNYSGGAYVCSRLLHGCGNIKIKAKWLDDVVNAYMSSMVFIDAKKVRPEEPKEEQPDPVAKIDRKIDAARQANIDGDLDLVDLLAMLKELRALRTEALKRQVEAVEVANWQPVEDYDKADLSVQRSIVRRHIEAIMVMPAKRGLNKFDESRCYVLRPDGSKVALAAINVIDFREMIPGYPVTYPIESRVRDAKYARPANEINDTESRKDRQNKFWRLDKE